MEHNVMIIKNKRHNGGIVAPAITIVARNPETKRGWKNLNQVQNTNEIMQEYCHTYNNIEKCISESTFNQTEAVKIVTIGFDRQKHLMDPNLWTEDLTTVWTGRSFTLNIPQTIQPDYEDELFIQFEKKLFHDIFIHDKHFFIMNLNLIGLPSIYKRLNPNTTDSHYYQFSLTEHEELNVPNDPCNEDKNYIYQVCIKQSISNQVGCKSYWDQLEKNNNIIQCNTLEEYRYIGYLIDIVKIINYRVSHNTVYTLFSVISQLPD